MKSLRSRLPPTNALVTFEAVARHLSFTAAGRELGVSQAATSRQVRLLEDHLGATLFNRAQKRVRLTPAGDQLLQAVTMGFGHIANVSDGLRQAGRERALTVATSIAFSAFWLMPRLPGFHAVNPAQELRLATSDSEADWFAEDVDIAVVFGPPGAAGRRPETLFGDQVVAVCRPDYFARRAPPETLEALQGETLLHVESPNITWLSWSDWFARNGAPLRLEARGPRFNNYTIAVQAALDGQGLVLGWRRLIARHLEDGRLMQVTAGRVAPEHSYALLIPEGSRNDRRVRAFRDWIVSEAERDWH